MIIKRNLRAQMPALKRCNAQPSAASLGSDDLTDDSPDQIRIKRRKPSGGDNFFPLEALGHLAAACIPYLPPEFRRRFLEAEVSSPPPDPPAAARPPVVRTLGGWAQVLPSKFNDSVLIDPWKKEKPKAKALDSELDADEVAEVKGKGGGRVFSCKDQNLEVWLRKEECYRACRILSAKKHSTPRSSLTSVHEESLKLIWAVLRRRSRGMGIMRA